MHSSLRLLAPLAIASLLAACSGGSMTTTPPVSTGSETLSSTHSRPATPAERGLWPRPGPASRVCSAAPEGFAACASWIRTDASPNVAVGGYYPSDLQTAYGLTSASATGGSGATVAIVDAFDDPNAASDLAAYRSQFGLPTCTTASGCFTKMAYARRANVGWAEEESLDVDMVSAICPNCKILLVEAASNSTSDLTTAERYATAHANYVSNSWSGNESTSTASIDQYYQPSGKVVTAATGDNGYNSVAQWPAILPGVVGVGGTALTSASPRAESVWSGAGSGCSKIYPKPSYQSTLTTGCTMRAEADASADADPNTGVAVYDTYHVSGSGWLVFGGTSVATPILASVYALSGNTNTLAPLYASDSLLNGITSGSNGSCGVPLCTANAQDPWNGPTGLGTPNGIGAF